eukprot:462949_1
MGLLLIIALYVATLKSASLYGIKASTPEDNGSLEKFNITSGEKQEIVEQSCYTSQSISCFDNKNKIWNIICQQPLKSGSTYAMRYNLSSNKVLSNISLPLWSGTGAADADIQCVSNTNNGNIYIFGPSQSNKQNQIFLELITDTQGKVTVNTIKKYTNDSIDQILVGPTFSPIFDSKRNMIYVGATVGSGADVMLYIDVNNGNISKIINKSEYPIPVSIYDQKLDQIIGLVFDKEGNNSDWIYSLCYADPVTLNITKKLNPFNDWCMWTNELSIDEENQILYQPIWKSTNKKYTCQQNAQSGYVASYFIAIDINDGSVVGSAPFGGLNNIQRDFPWDILYYPD